jgi:hypothetical protein
MSAARVFFMVFYGLLALIGVIMAAAARDIGITIFGWGLVAFGVLNAFNSIRMHFDEAEGRH